MANNLLFFGGRKGEKYPLECSIELKGQPLLCPRNINGCCRVFSSLDPLPSSPLWSQCVRLWKREGGSHSENLAPSALPDDSKVSAASKLLLHTTPSTSFLFSACSIRSNSMFPSYISVSGSSLLSLFLFSSRGWFLGSRREGGGGRKGKMKPCH